MNKRQIQGIDRLGRIQQYVLENAITPAIPRATVLLTEVDTLHGNMLAYGSGQEGGANTYHSGAAQRQALRADILGIVTDIWDTAKSLDPAEHAGIRALFRLNEARTTYARLINTGASFVDHMTAPAVKTLFTDRGFDADFDTDLTAKLTALAAATGIKFQGRIVQSTGTVGLDAMMRRAVVVVRELSSIVIKRLRSTNPLLIPVWRAAARLYKPAVAPATAPAVTPGGDPGSGTEGEGGGTTPPSGS